MVARRLRIADLADTAPVVAQRLLGCELAVGPVRGLITETEAYHSEDDIACHASGGKTARNAPLYEAPGGLYCYLCYGIHVLMNIVTGEEGIPSAVLIRGLRITDGHDQVTRLRGRCDDRAANGPGKVTQALGMDRSWNRRVLGDGWTLSDRHALPAAVSAGPRVGVGYAGAEWANRPWRWWLSDFPVVKQRPYRDI